MRGRSRGCSWPRALALVLALPAAASAGVTLAYCGYIGGDRAENPPALAVDASGSAYVCAATYSSQATFPLKVGPDLTFNGAFSDAFVAKVRADGTGLVYAGYVGGDQSDAGLGVGVDASGNVYASGNTQSMEGTFPVIVGPDLTFNGALDMWVAKVRTGGSGLDYSGYIGGASGDSGGVTVDAAGSAYAHGNTYSSEATFPVKVGPDLTFNGGLTDTFVAKVRADGTGIVYAGYIGGDGDERPDAWNGLAVDATGNAYVLSNTESTEATFPVTVGPDVTYNGGSSDAFVAKVRASGSGLEYAGYIGGDDMESIAAVAVEAAGNALVAGATGSAEATFPVKVGPDLSYNGDSRDAFVAKVRPDGKGLVYAGYIGGNARDADTGVAVDAAGDAFVAGGTSSTETTFPVALGPDLTYNDGGDAFLARVAADGTGLVHAGYIGGDSNDGSSGVALDAVASVYISGGTGGSFPQANFPVTVGPDLTDNGGSDVFVAKLTASCLVPPASPVVLLKLVKVPGALDDVAMQWQADPSAAGYNVWYVLDKMDIPDARKDSSPPAIPVPGCAPPSPAPSNACTDLGAVPRDTPAAYFYQARAFCDPAREGP